MGGATVAAVAAELGVDRSTIWRWRKSPAWRALETQLRAELVADIRHRVAGLVDLAFDCLAANVGADVDLALTVINKWGGSFLEMPTDPTDAEEVEAADQEAARLRQRAAAQRQADERMFDLLSTPWAQ